ncbi:MAG: ribonuclease III domain-containing protein [Eubacteriales bacterium]|nr:ribonuclease III domain-containing protein [Eubacteriales bacterium]
MEPLLFQPMMTEAEARQKTPLALAFIGDTVWDFLVRRRLLCSSAKAGTLHKQAIQLVNAGTQAKAALLLEPYLLDAEAEIFRRGKNAHAKHAAPKNQNPVDYSTASGLEALLGYLCLTGQWERIGELFDIAVPIH